MGWFSLAPLGAECLVTLLPAQLVAGVGPDIGFVAAVLFLSHTRNRREPSRDHRSHSPRGNRQRNRQHRDSGKGTPTTPTPIQQDNHQSRLSNPAKLVPEDLYDQASTHYDDKALATLAMAIGQVCFFIPLALIGKPLPGVSPMEQWR